MVFTKDMLRAVYDMLEMTEPFCRWNLPPSEDIEFAVTQSPKISGRCSVGEGPTFKLEVSNKLHTYPKTMMATMAHEMIHVYQACAGIEFDDGQGFKVLAAEVCEAHGFDLGAFL
jgi:hypothetical protein